MSKRAGIGLAVLALAVALLTVVVGMRSMASPGPLAAEGSASADAARPEGVVAMVGGREITRRELEESLATQLLQLEQQRHQVLEQGLDSLISERLLQIEAEGLETSPEALVAARMERAAPVTDADVDAFYEARKDQIGQPKEQIVGRIREFLEQQRRQEAQAALLEELKAKHQARSLLEPFRFEVATAGAPSAGPADAPVTIVEFSDFECPFCSRLVPTLERVREEYADRVRLVFRQFPLSSIHPNAQKAAEASLCAHDQQKFWPMHDTLFREQRALGVEQLKQKAARLDLDAEVFNQCLDSGQHADQVRADLEAGSALGVTGTPALFINGRLLSGAQPFEEIARLIDDELARGGG